MPRSSHRVLRTMRGKCFWCQTIAHAMQAAERTSPKNMSNQSRPPLPHPVTTNGLDLPLVLRTVPVRAASSSCHPDRRHGRTSGSGRSPPSPEIAMLRSTMLSHFSTCACHLGCSRRARSNPAPCSWRAAARGTAAPWTTTIRRSASPPRRTPEVSRPVWSTVRSSHPL